MLLEKGSCHRATSLLMAEDSVCLLLPPYSPALTPIERLWQEVNAQLAWRVPLQIEALEYQLETILRHDTKAAMQSLTAYPYVVQAVHALCS